MKRITLITITSICAASAATFIIGAVGHGKDSSDVIAEETSITETEAQTEETTTVAEITPDDFASASASILAGVDTIEDPKPEETTEEETESETSEEESSYNDEDDYYDDDSYYDDDDDDNYYQRTNQPSYNRTETYTQPSYTQPSYTQPSTTAAPVTEAPTTQAPTTETPYTEPVTEAVTNYDSNELF